MTLRLKLKSTDEAVDVLVLGLCSTPRDRKLFCGNCRNEIGDSDYGVAGVRINGRHRSIRVCNDCMADITGVPERTQPEMLEDIARQVGAISLDPRCNRVVEAIRILQETAERIRNLARVEVDT